MTKSIDDKLSIQTVTFINTGTRERILAYQAASGIKSYMGAVRELILKGLQNNS